MLQSAFVISCFCLTLISGSDRELRFYYNREYRTQDLWNAILTNNTALFDTIISRNSTNLRETDALNRTPLLMAVSQNNVHMTRALLDRNDELDIDAQDYVGHSALHTSCFDHNREITRLLIQAGADVNIDSDVLERPIIMAQREDNRPLLELLVNAGAQINFQDDQGQSPLHEAAAYGALANVRYLINHGANLTLREEGGFTAEEWICYCKRVDERVEAPCVPGSCTDEKIRQIQRVFRNARQQSNEPESSLPRIDDLWSAVVSRSMDHINRILNCDCVELQSVTQSTTDDWIEGETALHLAIRTGVLSICEALVEAGADPESRNALRNTPLHLAAMTGPVQSFLQE